MSGGGTRSSNFRCGKEALVPGEGLGAESLGRGGEGRRSEPRWYDFFKVQVWIRV